MIEFIIKYWVQWLMGLLALGIGTLATFVKIQFSKNKAIRNGLRVLLYRELYEAYQIHIERGYIHANESRLVENLYNAYHDLGGNGTGTQLYEEISKLPKIKKEKDI